MVGRSKDGALHALYQVHTLGVRYCSMCGERMATGDHYTKQVVYDPVYRRKTWMARCTHCISVEVVPWNDIEMRDTPVRVSTPPPPERETTGSMRPVPAVSDDSWLNSPTPPLRQGGSRWERAAPTHIADVRTMELGTVRISTDPKLKKLLAKVWAR